VSEEIVWVGEQSTAPAVGLVGGKGLGLDLCQRAGLRVPEAFVVSTECFRQALRDQLRAELSSVMAAVAGEQDIDAFDSATERARKVLFEGTAGHPGEAAIREAFAQLQQRTGTSDLAVAVRSSSAAEDAADRSFAGEHDTYLWVRGADEVCEKVRRCWTSLYTSRASAYRTDVGHDADDAMAVVVQRMIDARAAGVFMTLNPSNGDRSKIVIESLWSLGEPLVSGTATPDRFTIDKVTGEILERQLADKPERMTGDPQTGRGTRMVQVPEAERTRASLTDDEIGQLVEMGRRVERFAGAPQDGEFAVDETADAGGDVYLVQARPETVWTNKSARRVGGGSDVLNRVVSTLTRNPDPATKS
jgi:pyruvate,water dikinase